MLSKIDKVLLAGLVRSDMFQALRNLVDEMILNWNNKPVVGDTEFTYLKASLERDWKAIGARRIIDEIESLYKTQI